MAFNLILGGETEVAPEAARETTSLTLCWTPRPSSRVKQQGGTIFCAFLPCSAGIQLEEPLTRDTF